MNTTQVVRWEGDSGGVNLRLWIDDESGQHVAVSELRVGRATLEAWSRSVDHARNRDGEQHLTFDA